MTLLPRLLRRLPDSLLKEPGGCSHCSRATPRARSQPRTGSSSSQRQQSKRDDLRFSIGCQTLTLRVDGASSQPLEGEQCQWAWHHPPNRGKPSPSQPEQRRLVSHLQLHSDRSLRVPKKWWAPRSVRFMPSTNHGKHGQMAPSNTFTMPSASSQQCKVSGKRIACLQHICSTTSTSSSSIDFPFSADVISGATRSPQPS